MGQGLSGSSKPIIAGTELQLGTIADSGRSSIRTIRGPSSLERHAAAKQDLSAARIGRVLPETRATHVGDGVPEIPVIQQVEKLTTELQRHSLGDRELLDQSNVLAVIARTTEGVASQVAETDL